jgi:hypothetical protein
MISGVPAIACAPINAIVSQLQAIETARCQFSLVRSSSQTRTMCQKLLGCASDIVDPNQPSENPPDVHRMGSDTTLLLDQASREIWYRTTLAVAASSISWAVDGIDLARSVSPRWMLVKPPLTMRFPSRPQALTMVRSQI